MHSTAVIKRNIAAQHREHLFILAEFAAMNRLRLHRMEEGLHERIVGHLAPTVHAAHELERLVMFSLHHIFFVDHVGAS